MEFLLGGIAACGAGFFTNPLEVVKTRMQLQGELKAKGQYSVYYKNVFHAFYTIGKVDGLLALQKGLAPALWYQFLMNGWRLGAYQCFINMGFTTDKNGNNSWIKSVAAGATAGTIGAAVGSPVYMIKTHLQAAADQSIAVGYQHKHHGMWAGLRHIHRVEGVRGLWRGVDGAIARVMVGSATQLSTFTTSKQFYISLEIFHKDSVFNAILASMTSGVVVVACMTPFDVISTRLYNQGTDAKGKGLYYKGVFDCFTKVLRTEGIWGFYKGWGASLFRLGPHTVLSLSMWDQIRRLYFYMNNRLNYIEDL